MNYDVQNALNQKAEKFEIHDLQRENQSLKNEVRDMVGKLTRLNNENGGLREVVLRLIDTLSEREEDEMFNRLQELRHLL